MISKELLSSVLGLTVFKVLELDGAILWYKGIVNINGSPCAKELNINIYELSYKCKEWALKKDKYKWLFSYKSFTKCHCDIVDNHNRKYIFMSFSCETEPEAIFKACEWILTKDSK